MREEIGLIVIIGLVADAFVEYDDLTGVFVCGNDVDAFGYIVLLESEFESFHASDISSSLDIGLTVFFEHISIVFGNNLI